MVERIFEVSQGVQTSLALPNPRLYMQGWAIPRKLYMWMTTYDDWVVIMTDIPNLDLFVSAGNAMVPCGTLDKPDFEILTDMWNERKCSEKKVILGLFASIGEKTINIGDYKQGRGVRVHDWKVSGWEPQFPCSICGQMTPNFIIHDGVEVNRGDHGHVIDPGTIMAFCFEHS